MSNSVEVTPQPGPGAAAPRANNRVSSYFEQRPRAKWVLTSAVLLGIVAAFLAWRYFATRETTDDAQIDGHIIPISSRVGGTVLKVAVDDNQSVEAGTVLVQIDPRDYQVALEKAQADYADAQASAEAARTGVMILSTTTGSQLSNTRAGVTDSQAGVEAAQRDVDAAHSRRDAARAELQLARANDTKAARDLERMKQLIAKDEISQQQYDATVAAADAARAAVASADAAVAEAESRSRMADRRLDQARARLEQSQGDVRSAETAPQQVAAARARAAAAEAKVQQAKAALDQARLNLDYATVKAPASGVVSKKTVEVGQVVQAGQPLLAIVPLDDIWVTANFKETQLKNMRPGQPAIISVDAYGRRKYRGHVNSIASATGAKFSLLPPENATGNYVKVVQRVPVKIVFEKGQDPERLLRPGMSVVPTVITK